MKLICQIFPVIFICLNLTGCKSAGSHAPILILGTRADFGTYTAEILKTEGFNEYELDSLTSTNTSLRHLLNFDLVILGETKVTSDQARKLTEYVRKGGNLIAFKPDTQLSGVLGVTPAKGGVKEGYIKITDTITGRGLIRETIQFHGKSDIYRLKDAEIIAELYTDAVTPSGYPAVVKHRFGRGQAAAFAYNLPKSIVYTRQGNPEWAGQERDKTDGPTATDLFYPLAGEVQWNDPGKIALPQADEQMRLLSHIMEKFNSDRKPLPRFWYFPEMYKCVYIFTIDGEETPESDISNEIADVNGKGGKATLYEIGTYIREETVKAWRASGNEVAIHFNDVPNYADPNWLNMNTVLDTMTAIFRKAYGISPKTVRNHWVVWCSKDPDEKLEFAAQAAMEEKYGLGFDCNYYQFGGNKVYPNWLGDVGHFTGSGLPMKFADSEGRILNIYQSNTQLPDETWLKENIESKSKILIDRSLDEENFTYINANFHTWYWGECRAAGLSVLDHCNSRGVPVWTAEYVYEFLKMKDEAGFSDIDWSGNRLTFTVASSIKHTEGLTILLPFNHGNLKITDIWVSDREQPFRQQFIKGFEYASITVAPGSTYNISVGYH